MSERRIPPDPSMEEILASIRRIISDDDPKPGPSPAPAPARGAVPDEPVIAMPLAPPPEEDEEPAAAAPAAMSPPAARVPPEPVLELTQVLREDGAVVNILRPDQATDEERPLYRPRIVSEGQGAADPSLVSADVAAEAAKAISAIGRLEHGASGPGPGDRGTAGGQTVEDLVRELLRPMLKEWLDARLPGLVETVVREEIERIVRRSNLR
jgi:cell pole-organizing protein PopZ